MTRTATSFDRLRPRTLPPTGKPDPADPVVVGPLPAPRRDPQGFAALFTPTVPRRLPLGSVLIECSACHARTVVTAMTAARLALPSLHLPGLRTHPSFMRCPACRKRTWVRLHVHG